MKNFPAAAFTLLILPLFFLGLMAQQQLTSSRQALDQAQEIMEVEGTASENLGDTLKNYKHHLEQQQKFQTLQNLYALILAIAGLYYLFHQRQEMKNLRESHQRSREMVRQSISDYDKKVHSIALDLHDDIAQNLYIALTSLNENPPQASRLIRESLNKIRHLSTDLRPGEAVTLPIKVSLQKLCEGIAESAPFQIHYRCNGISRLRLSSEKRIQIYRIIQESLMNALKHSQAKLVQVTILGVYPQLLIKIEDDGVGMPNAQRCLEESLGLRSLRERTVLLEGDFSLRSTPNQGTKIEISLPLERAPEPEGPEPEEPEPEEPEPKEAEPS